MPLKQGLVWFDISPAELSAYLVLRLVAEQYSLQNPATQLMGLHVFSPELSLGKIEPLAMQVIQRLRSQEEVWRRIEVMAAEFLTPRRLGRVFDGLLPGQSREERVSYIRRADAVALVAQRHVLHILKEFFSQSPPVSMTWVDSLGDVRLGEKQAEAGLNLLRLIRKIEAVLEKPVTAVPHL